MCLSLPPGSVLVMFSTFLIDFVWFIHLDVSFTVLKEAPHIEWIRIDAVEHDLLIRAHAISPRRPYGLLLNSRLAVIYF